MCNPTTTPGGGLDFLRFAEAAAAKAGVEVNAAYVNDVAEIERVVAAVAGEVNGGLINLPDIFLVIHKIGRSTWLRDSGIQRIILDE
jgi:hypothetical protein